MTLFYETTSGEAALTYVKTDMVIESTTALLSGVMARLETIVQNDIEENSFRTLALLWDELPLMAENDDISTLKAARAGKYYITDRMRALVENYFDSCKGRLYEVIEQSRRGNTENVERKRQGDVKEPVQDRNSKTEEDEENAAY